MVKFTLFVNGIGIYISKSFELCASRLLTEIALNYSNEDNKNIYAVKFINANKALNEKILNVNQTFNNKCGNYVSVLKFEYNGISYDISYSYVKTYTITYKIVSEEGYNNDSIFLQEELKYLTEENNLSRCYALLCDKLENNILREYHDFDVFIELLTNGVECLVDEDNLKYEVYDTRHHMFHSVSVSEND